MIDFPDLICTCTHEVLLLHSEPPLTTLSSAVVGGGLIRTHYLLNWHVDQNYHGPDPENDLRAFATSIGITAPFVGLMTAARLQRARTRTLREDPLTVAGLVTAGLSNPTSAGRSQPAPLTPGTINLILLIDAHLTPAAMVNAVITATEAKTHVLLERGVRTPDNEPATGTSTDAIVIACTGYGPPLPYAGPATQVGWLIGRCVRQTLGAALDAR